MLKIKTSLINAENVNYAKYGHFIKKYIDNVMEKLSANVIIIIIREKIYKS